MTTNSLLPPNATASERALEKAIRPGPDVIAGVDLIRTAKEDPPDDWLMWLIWEYGLEELLPYLPDPRMALKNGLAWQQIRGTPNSLRLAMGWLGLSAAIEEETPGGAHWFEYQLDPGAVPSPADLRNLVGLCNLSAPVRSRLKRVFHDYDMRRGVWDQFAWSDGSLWSADSGIFVPELGIDISFGRRLSSFVEVGEIEVGASLAFEVVSHTHYEDRLIYGLALYDEPVVRNHPLVSLVERHVLGQGVGRNLRVLDGTWTLNGTVALQGGVLISTEVLNGEWRLDGSQILGGVVAEELSQYPAKHTTHTEPEGILGWDPIPWPSVNWYGL